MSQLQSGNLVIWQSGDWRRRVRAKAFKLPDYQIARSPHRSAFTLLELILALGLTIIVATIFSASLYTAFKAKAAIDTAVEATRATDTAADMIAHELALAQAPSPVPATASTVINLPGSNLGATTQTLIGPFEGDGQSLDFFISGPEPKAPIQADIREVQYSILPDPDNNARKNLVRSVRTNLLEPEPTWPPGDVLAPDVLNFTVKYFDGTTWADVWDSTAQNNQLPLAVQFTLELAPLPPSTKTRLDTRTIALPLHTPILPASTTGGTP